MKRQIIEQIRVLMKEYDISLSEIAYKQDKPKKVDICFDLLCMIGGQYKRLPFYTGKDRNPIAIFPFSDSNIALRLDEKPEQSRYGLAESNIPTTMYWTQVFAIRNHLNMALKELGEPIIDGYYFAEPMIGSRPSWIVGFRDDYKTMPSDYYDSDEKAKVRYCFSI